MSDKLSSFVGLAMRAGKIVSGSLPVEKALNAKKALVLLIDESISENSLSAYKTLAERNGIAVLIMKEGTLCAAIGKPGRMAAAVTEQGFAKQILKLASEAGLHIIGGVCN